MGVQSVDRAIEILEAVSVMGNATTGELARRLDVHKSTASRLLASLSEHGLVEHMDAGAYRLGFGLVRLAGSVVSTMDFSQFAQRLCDHVAADLGLTANVAVLDEGYAVNVSQAVGAGLLAPHHYVGIRTPGHATSSGKLLLAFDADSRAAVLAGRAGQTGASPGAGTTHDGPAHTVRLERHTAATLTDPADLARDLESVRERDWAAVDEEWEEHITAVAVPLRLPNGDVEAALTVTGPTHALPPASFADVAAALQRAAGRSGRWV